MKSLHKLFGAVTPCLALVLLTGCPTDDGEDADTDVGDTMGDTTETMGTETMGTDTMEELSHAADIQPLWDEHCISCHAPGGSAAFLDMTDGYATMVGVDSTQATGKELVMAGDSAESYLVAKLRGTQVEFGGTGGQMPVGASPLSDEDIALVVMWIDEGALP